MSDDDVRRTIYERWVDLERPPSVSDVAAALGIAVGEAVDAFRRLDAARLIVLTPGTDHLWMVHPLSATPTAFRVETQRGSYFGNCVWDGLGVVAMLGEEGTVETRCPDCDEPMTLRVEGGELVEGYGVAHFAVPAARWWDDIGFT